MVTWLYLKAKLPNKFYFLLFSCCARVAATNLMFHSIWVIIGMRNNPGGWLADNEMIIRLTQSAWAGAGTELGKKHIIR